MKKHIKEYFLGWLNGEESYKQEVNTFLFMLFQLLLFGYFFTGYLMLIYA